MSEHAIERLNDNQRDIENCRDRERSAECAGRVVVVVVVVVVAVIMTVIMIVMIAIVVLVRVLRGHCLSPSVDMTCGAHAERYIIIA
jgi:hypothetical protein